MIKIKKLVSLFALCCVFMTTKAQVKYYDAAVFPLYGKISDQTETRYERLPASIKDICRPPVWGLGKNTAGLAIRFRSNSKNISARWTLLQDYHMNHMAGVGIRGLDLYCLEKGGWRFVNVGRPVGKENAATIISNMNGEEREYMLYLPLYDGVTHLEIGIDSLASIEQPRVESPVRKNPVIYYGTSISQGGCASRPGMAHTNILSRRLNREFINLGFSGNGQLDYEIAEIITGRDASLIVLDFMPNVNLKQIHEKADKFYQILRSKSPNVPILFIENPIFPFSDYDLSMQNVLKDKNDALRVFFKSLIKKGEKNIYFLSSDKLIGTDGEATVDGIHFTDLGFQRFADCLYPVIKSKMKD
ncbi:SGNH/GDSL hydrolase family protein [Bacteroides sedimenti]